VNRDVTGWVHLLNTSRTRAMAASFSAADPPNRGLKAMTYFMMASFAKDSPLADRRDSPGAR
jgi:hypothetical protein